MIKYIFMIHNSSFITQYKYSLTYGHGTYKVAYLHLFIYLYIYIYIYMRKGKVHPLTGHEGPEVQQRYSCTLSLTSALHGVGGQSHAPAAPPPGETRYPSYRRLGGLEGRSGRVRKISPPTGIRSPDRPVRSESLYRLRYPYIRIFTNFLIHNIVQLHDLCHSRPCTDKCITADCFYSCTASYGTNVTSQDELLTRIGAMTNRTALGTSRSQFYLVDHKPHMDFPGSEYESHLKDT